MDRRNFLKLSSAGVFARLLPTYESGEPNENEGKESEPLPENYKFSPDVASFEYVVTFNNKIFYLYRAILEDNSEIEEPRYFISESPLPPCYLEKEQKFLPDKKLTSILVTGYKDPKSRLELLDPEHSNKFVKLASQQLNYQRDSNYKLNIDLSQIASLSSFQKNTLEEGFFPFIFYFAKDENDLLGFFEKEHEYWLSIFSKFSQNNVNLDDIFKEIKQHNENTFQERNKQNPEDLANKISTEIISEFKVYKEALFNIYPKELQPIQNKFTLFEKIIEKFIFFQLKTQDQDILIMEDDADLKLLHNYSSLFDEEVLTIKKDLDFVFDTSNPKSGELVKNFLAFLDKEKLFQKILGQQKDYQKYHEDIFKYKKSKFNQSDLNKYFKEICLDFMTSSIVIEKAKQDLLFYLQDDKIGFKQRLFNYLNRRTLDRDKTDFIEVFYNQMINRINNCSIKIDPSINLDIESLQYGESDERVNSIKVFPNKVADIYLTTIHELSHQMRKIDSFSPSEKLELEDTLKMKTFELLDQESTEYIKGFMEKYARAFEIFVTAKMGGVDFDVPLKAGDIQKIRNYILSIGASYNSFNSYPDATIENLINLLGDNSQTDTDNYV